MWLWRRVALEALNRPPTNPPTLDRLPGISKCGSRFCLGPLDLASDLDKVTAGTLTPPPLDLTVAAPGRFLQTIHLAGGHPRTRY